MPKPVQKFQVEEIVSFDDDVYPGDVLGYYCEGHVDKQQFAIACNQEYDLAANESPIHVSQVEQGYFFKQYEVNGYPVGDGQYLLIRCKAETPGAIAATFVGL